MKFTFKKALTLAIFLQLVSLPTLASEVEIVDNVDAEPFEKSYPVKPFYTEGSNFDIDGDGNKNSNPPPVGVEVDDSNQSLFINDVKIVLPDTSNKLIAFCNMGNDGKILVYDKKDKEKIKKEFVSQCRGWLQEAIKALDK